MGTQIQHVPSPCHSSAPELSTRFRCAERQSNPIPDPSPSITHPVRGDNSPANGLAAPISACDGAERNEGRGVFAREPDAALGATVAEGLDVLVEADLVGLGRLRGGAGEVGLLVGGGFR